MSNIYKAYAQGLFDAGLELEKEESFLEQLKAINDTFKQVKELKVVFASHRVKKHDLDQIIDSIFGEYDAYLLRFLHIMNQRNELDKLEKIYHEYELIYREYKGIEIVKVETASELSDSQKADLIRVLESKLNKKVTLEISICPELIAGMRILANGLILDNSVLSRINAIKAAIS